MTSSPRHIGPVTHVEVASSTSSFSRQLFFFSSGPSIFTRDDATDKTTLIYTIPSSTAPGRIISKFTTSSSSASGSNHHLQFCLAAHNEVFYFELLFSTGLIVKNERYCGRTLDRILDITFGNNKNGDENDKIICLGHEGVICSFGDLNSNNSSINHNEQQYLLKQSPLGLCLAGSINNNNRDSNSKNTHHQSFYLGTSFGDVVEFKPSSSSSSSQFEEISRVNKCHQNGLVSCMSAIKHANEISYFATASDERRACLVYWKQKNESHQEQKNKIKVQLPFEPGRIRSVDAIFFDRTTASSDEKSSPLFLIATGCEDGWIRCYSVDEYSSNSSVKINDDDGVVARRTPKLIFAEEVFASGIGGGAGSLKLFLDENQNDDSSSIVVNIFSGGFEGTTSINKQVFSLGVEGNHQEDGSSNKLTTVKKKSFDHSQVRCVLADDGNVARSFVALANGEVWSSSSIDDGNNDTNCWTQIFCRQLIIHDNDGKQTSITPSALASSSKNHSSIFLGTTSGEVYFLGSNNNNVSSDSSASATIPSLLFRHPQKAAITSLNVVEEEYSASFSSSSNNSSPQQKHHQLVFSCNAAGSIVVYDSSSCRRQLIAVWDGVCQGRSVILPPSSVSSVVDSSPSSSSSVMTFAACDRRGVYLFQFSLSSLAAETTSQTIKHHHHQKIYNASQAFAGRADLWCPVTMHWESSSSRFSILHKNRMIQTIEFVVENSTDIGGESSNCTLSFASVPTPACPDLPVRDVLFSSRSHLVVQSGNQLMIWDRSQNQLYNNNIIPNVVAARLRYVTQSSLSSEFRFIWSNDSKEVCSTTVVTPALDFSSNNNSWGTCDLTCACAVDDSSSSVFVVGGDDGILSVWSVSKAKEEIRKVNSLLFHASSVLALCPVENVGFLSVGAYSSIGLWRKSTHNDHHFDLMYSKSAPPVSSSSSEKNNIATTVSSRTRETELERFISCDSHKNLMAVGSSCGHFLIIILSLLNDEIAEKDKTILETRLPVSSSNKEDLSPIISIGIVKLQNDGEILVFCGLNNGRLAVQKLQKRNGDNKKSTDVLEQVCEIDDFLPSSSDNNNCNNNEGAVSAIKIDHHYSHVIAAKESGRVFVIIFGPNGELSRSGIKSFHSTCATTPRVLLVSSLLLSTSDKSTNNNNNHDQSLFVVEEGRCVREISGAKKKSHYHSVVRVRGGCLLNNGKVIVVGQGIEMIEQQ